ncbi:MAG TPA: hypothetical protein VK574_19085 [Terracidiphilus sp.]|jgi:hypothetical protein|nr:hypothetical protein [Terracidiphilus sp.]
MRKINWIAPSLLALCVVSAGALKARSLEAQPVPHISFAQDHDRWDEPPSEYRDAQRRGFHEGVEAARHDMSERRHADADDHEMYKHPPVEGDARKEFREGFREGYRRAMEHMRHDHDDQPHI